MCTAKGTNDTCKVHPRLDAYSYTTLMSFPATEIYWPVQLIVKDFECCWKDRDECSTVYLNRTCSLARSGLENSIVLIHTSESQNVQSQQTWVRIIYFCALTSLHYSESTHSCTYVMDESKPDRKQIASYCNRVVV